jgi:hypothetical protein
MEHYESENFSVTIHDDLLKEFVVKKDRELQADDVKASLNFSAQVSPGAKFFVLFEVQDGGRISHEARTVGASAEYHGHTAALALCSSALPMAITGNFFLKINRPKVPTRYFEERAGALEWLRGMMQPAKAEGAKSGMSR